MKLRLFPILLVPLAAALLWVEPHHPARAAAAVLQEGDDQPAVPEGMEVEARGPVHEAYAEPSTSAPVAGPIASKAPPEPIEETPPEEKPDGDEVVWVPGYWSWDVDASDFLWVSGFWRTAPPGRSWVPGYWQQVTDGHQWVAGYWAEPAENGDERDVELLPEPPATVERGPAVPAPAVGLHHYVPGIWVFRTTRFVWRPGFWLQHRPGWVWTNACYRWTPAGYTYVHSFYDRPLLARGLLCAPVRFVRPIYTRRDFSYRPVYFVQPDFLMGSLFVSLQRRRFYFGNYFEPRYQKRFVSWNYYRVGRGSRVYDANYSYYRQAYAKHPTWERNLNQLYEGRFKGDIARPPVTLVQQRKVINNFTVNKTSNVVVNKTVNITNIQNSTVLAPMRRKTNVQVTGLSSLANLKPTASPVRQEVKVGELTAARRKEEVQQVNRMRTISQQRRDAVTKVAKTTTAATIKAPVKVKVDLPKTTPPPRRIVIKEKPPEAPKRPVFDEKVKPPPFKGKDKDKIKPPPFKGKDKEKDKVKPPPFKGKDKDKDKPPPFKGKDKEKDKVKPPPFKPKDRDKDKPPPFKPKDRDKDKPPPFKGKDKEKDKVKPPPPKPKEKEKVIPPPRPKEKENKPPPRPKEKEKEKPPPPRPKEKAPPPPRPKEKEKEKKKDRPAAFAAVMPPKPPSSLPGSTP